MNRHKLFTTKYMNMNMKLSDTNIKNSRNDSAETSLNIYVLPSPSRPLQNIDIKREFNWLIVPGYCYCATPDLAWPRAE